MQEATLYERLGGAFAIAAVIEHFSDAVVMTGRRLAELRAVLDARPSTPVA